MYENKINLQKDYYSLSLFVSLLLPPLPSIKKKKNILFRSFHKRVRVTNRVSGICQVYIHTVKILH